MVAGEGCLLCEELCRVPACTQFSHRRTLSVNCKRAAHWLNLNRKVSDKRIMLNIAKNKLEAMENTIDFALF